MHGVVRMKVGNRGIAQQLFDDRRDVFAEAHGPFEQHAGRAETAQRDGTATKHAWKFVRRKFRLLSTLDHEDGVA